MGVGSFRLCGCGFVGACGIKSDRLGGGLFGRFSEQPGGVDAPGYGDNIDDILAKKQKVISNGNQRKQTVGEQTQGSHGNYTVKGQRQIYKGEYPCLYRNDIQQQEPGVRIHCGISQKQAHVQISDICTAAKDHAENVHQQNAGKIKKVKPQRSPRIFHGSAKRIVAKQNNGGDQNVSCIVGEYVGEQSPYLSLQNKSAVEIQGVVQRVALVEQAQNINNGASQGHIEHQVGNAFISVFITKTFKFLSQIFQCAHLLCGLVLW